MSAKLTAVIDLINPGFVDCTLDTGTSKNLFVKKTVSVDDFKTLLDKGAAGNDMTLMPRFPEGMIDLSWYNESNYVVTVFVPAQVRPTAYLKEENVQTLPFPSLVFSFTAGKGMMTSSRVFAVKDARKRSIDNDTELFKFPYGNVHFDGKICWGNNQGINRLHGIKSLENVIETFFNSIMNSDLYSESTTRRKVSLEMLLSEMASVEVFPNDILAGAGMKYGELFKS